MGRGKICMIENVWHSITSPVTSMKEHKCYKNNTCITGKLSTAHAEHMIHN